MASKGPRSKLDNETRARRQKALEAPREPPWPRTHWDHVLEEMVWLSKDFESERKWKLAQAKKVAIRASKSILDHATRGEKKVKEEEQRLRKVAVNISKDVKKFWVKIEKLVLYKHQLELEERKKMARDKQLDFLLGQTERYSTMLAENLVDMPHFFRPVPLVSEMKSLDDVNKEERGHLPGAAQQPETHPDYMETDGSGIQSEGVLEDLHMLEEDEAQITEVLRREELAALQAEADLPLAEQREELAALQAEVDLPLEELLKNYTKNKVQVISVSREANPKSNEDVAHPIVHEEHHTNDSWNQVNGSRPEELPRLAGTEEYHSFGRIVEKSQSGNDFNKRRHEDRNGDYVCKEVPLTLKTTQMKPNGKHFSMHGKHSPFCSDDELDDREYSIVAEEDKDYETTLSEEEALTKKETTDPSDEINLLQQESEIPLEQLLARYRKDGYSDSSTADSECYSSSSLDQVDDAKKSDVQLSNSDSPLKGPFKPDSAKLEESELKEPCSVKESEENHDNTVDGRESEDIIADAAAAARSAQPTGNTFLTTKVRTKFPFLLKHPMREYQHIGLDWLVTMYEQRLNGILADEMGLGKTIMTISLLAHLACEKGIWGPHLIVVPTSVMLNWETEFLKWCPAFKILTYFGSAKERKHKRQGWLKPNYFHICITTYRLVIQDSKVFRRKKWKYLILDEAHLIKNWKSQRWQTLLNFNSKRQILLTGTPLQNDLMELWSLMHFLMPHVFQSHQEFKDWFSNPISGMVDGQEKVNKEVVDRLHNVLRPFILRRLKKDVEKQLPRKYEHVIYCRLSRRQRNLYEDFIANSETQATLASANYFGMISVIMQLRKVCNHPDLFEGRPIISSYDMAGIDMQVSSSICSILSPGPFSEVDMRRLNFVFTQQEFSMTSWEMDEIAAIVSNFTISEEKSASPLAGGSISNNKNDHRRKTHGYNIFEKIQMSLWEERVKQSQERAASISWWNSLRCQKKPVYGTNIRELVTIKHPVSDIHDQKHNPLCYMDFSSKLAEIVLSPVDRLHTVLDLIECFMFAIPASRAPMPVCWCNNGRSSVFLDEPYKEECTEALAPFLSPFRPAIVRRQVYFPDRRLIQFDCGKLQELAILLRRLKSEGHRALIFTQMTKMLDILEAFINLYGYTYMRLDGSTPPEERQTLMQRFNTNPKYFIFILSTRSGGVGINLVGADTVIFYDSDWNPAMDQQAQDRCHRIGQTREVHIYRLISGSTIEENILKKANQKRALDDLVIQSGSYNTEFFKKLDPMELFSGHGSLPIEKLSKGSSSAAESSNSGVGMLLSNADVEAAIKHAEDEADYIALKKVEQEEVVDNQEFTEEVVGRLDDDELVNDDDIKPAEKPAEEQSCRDSTVSREDDVALCANNLNEEKALILSVGDDDTDMLADIKQMAAAAAAAGQASSSFENQLRPIDRYAMRFLGLWDPVIDTSAIDFQVNVEGEEWELERIEKFKEDLEAEIDEDQEPFLYESWDADFATMAYRQRVETLAAKQLLEELEIEAQDADNVDDETREAVRSGAYIERKPKSKKRSKKTKFKSLKKGPLASDLEFVHEEPSVDTLSVDDTSLSPEVSLDESPPHSRPTKKRKKFVAAPEEENNSRKMSKKHKKAPERHLVVSSSSLVKYPMETRDLKSREITDNHDHKMASRSKSGGKISITVMPVKRVMAVKPERLKKRGHVWSKDCFPSPDPWSPQEDAVLCATVHEYDTHWSLVSDTLYGLPGGGFFIGRFRHPVHCCERFRELFYKYIQSPMDNSNTEKLNSSGSGKALLKVTEDHIRILLNVTSELPHKELLLQKHFVATISSVWRVNCRLVRYRSMPSSRIICSSISFSYGVKPSKLTGFSPMVLRQNSKLIMTALSDVNKDRLQEPVAPVNQLEFHAAVEKLDLLLEIPSDSTQYRNDFPSAIIMSICQLEPPCQVTEPACRNLLRESSCLIAENRYREASEACFEGEGPSWASSAFPMSDLRNRSSSKFQPSGKHKASGDLTKPPKSKVQRTTETLPDLGSVNKATLLPRHTQSPKHMECAVTPDYITELGTDCYSQYSGVDMFLQETHSHDFIALDYDSGFSAGLEDLGPLQDFTDIG